MDTDVEVRFNLKHETAHQLLHNGSLFCLLPKYGRTCECPLFARSWLQGIRVPVDTNNPFDWRAAKLSIVP